MSARALRRRSHRGFTLIELMISLVMGVIVALAAVGLARTATNTFYEQARISAVESTIRSASERLRSDLSRVSYMSTANVQWDPTVARVPGGVGAPYRVTALQNLQGLRIGVSAIRTHVLEAKNALTPQDVSIAGNLASDDVYRGQYVANGGACGGGGVQVRLDALADPAVNRLFNGATTAADRQTATQLVFTPGELMVPAVTGMTYAVQVMDMRGCFNYMTICGVTQAAQTGQVVLELAGDSAVGILSPQDTGGDVCGARVMEEVAVAPIQRVRWRIAQDTDTRRVDPTLDMLGGASTKLNLERQILAADGTTAVGPAEIVAEYAVNLMLGLVVDTSADVLNPTPSLIDFGAPDSNFATWAGPVTSTMSGIGPERIRSVRYLLAFRTPVADRHADLPMPAGGQYISRYCMTNDTTCTDYARVRTVISEVALLNQAKATY